MRSDQGGEIINETLSDLFSENGISHEFTASYSPESNGKAEKLKRTFVQLLRSLLDPLGEINSVEYKELWAETMYRANYIRNSVLKKGTGAHSGHKTLFEILNGRKPNVGNIRIFGTKEHVLGLPPSKGSKFD